MRRRLLPFAPGLLALIAGLDSRAQEALPKAGEIVIESASVQPPGLGRVDFELGTLHVPENRAEKSSRLIGVGFARFKAESVSGAPPVFLLPGGPGGSYLDDLKPGSPRLGLVRELLRQLGLAPGRPFVSLERLERVLELNGCQPYSFDADAPSIERDTAEDRVARG